MTTWLLDRTLLAAHNHGHAFYVTWAVHLTGDQLLDHAETEARKAYATGPERDVFLAAVRGDVRRARNPQAMRG